MRLKLHPANFIPLLSVPAAFFMADAGRFFYSYTAWILAAMLFFSFLGLRMSELRWVAHHPLRSLASVILILVICPLVIFPVAKVLFPEYLMGAMIFMMLPAAVSSPAVAAIYGGDVALATIDAVLSNLLSVVSIPVLVGLVAHESVRIGAGKILGQMVIVVLVPFVAGTFVSHFFERVARRIHRHSREINLWLLFLLFFAALSPFVSELVANLANMRLILAVLLTNLVLLALARLAIRFIKEEKERMGMLCNILLPNVGLGVVLAQSYFGPKEIMFMIFCDLVWIAMVGLIDYVK